METLVPNFLNRIWEGPAHIESKECVKLASVEISVEGITDCIFRRNQNSDPIIITSMVDPDKDRNTELRWVAASGDFTGINNLLNHGHRVIIKQIN